MSNGAQPRLPGTLPPEREAKRIFAEAQKSWQRARASVGTFTAACVDARAEVRRTSAAALLAADEYAAAAEGADAVLYEALAEAQRAAVAALEMQKTALLGKREARRAEAMAHAAQSRAYADLEAIQRGER